MVELYSTVPQTRDSSLNQSFVSGPEPARTRLSWRSSSSNPVHRQPILGVTSTRKQSESHDSIYTTQFGPMEQLEGRGEARSCQALIGGYLIEILWFSEPTPRAVSLAAANPSLRDLKPPFAVGAIQVESSIEVRNGHPEDLSRTR